MAVSLTVAATACSSEPVGSYKEAVEAIAHNDYETARIYLNNLLQREPGNMAARLLSGKVAVELAQSDRAISDLKAVLNDPKLGAQARPLLARAYLLKNDGQRALEALGEGEPADAMSYAIAVSANLLTGKQESAVQLLDAGLSRFPNSPDLLILEGNRAISLGQTDRAQEIVSNVIKAAPDHIEARIFAGRLALIRKDLKAAQTHFEHVVKLRPNHQLALLALAAIANDQGDKDGAKKLIAKAMQTGGGPVAIYMSAQIAFDAGKIEEAQKLLQSLESEENPLPDAMMLSGLISARQGNHQQAISVLRDYISGGGIDPRARYAFAASLAATGDDQQAWTALEPLAKAQNADLPTLALAAKLTGTLKLPSHDAYQQRAEFTRKGDPDAKAMQQADAALRAGDWQKADGIYAGLLADGRVGSAILLNNAANTRLQLGDNTGAVALARRALAQAPEDPIILDTLGWALFKAGGKTPEVVDLIRKAGTLAPTNTEIRDHWISLSSAP